MNGATALVQMLSAYEVEVIFGVPGDTNVALYQALRGTAGSPRHVTCRDERSALFMADCYARLTGKPGVAEVPSGAGALYAIPGVAEANKSSVPVILLVNDIPQPGTERGTLTELPVEELFRPISKHAETLGHVSKLPELVRQAFRKATAGRPGGVVLALPEDLLFQSLPETGVSLHVEKQCTRAPSTRLRPEHPDILAALDAVLQVPAVLIHSNNACFGWIKALQRVTERHHAREVAERSEEPRQRRANDVRFGVDFGACDMSKLAGVYGIKSYRAETPDSLDTALAEAFALNEPLFIEVAVTSIADRMPPVFSWLKKVGADPEAIGTQAAL